MVKRESYLLNVVEHILVLDFLKIFKHPCDNF